MAEDDDVRFRGGSQSRRDKWFGIVDADFKRWWHRHGKREVCGRDLSTPEEAREVYDIWQSEGRRKAR